MPDHDIHGAAYVFGFADADVTGFSISGFTPRMASFDCEPEVFAQATNGEGFVEAIAIATPAARKLTVSITGYISSGFSRTSAANTFSIGSRFFSVTKISDPRKKGEFIEVTVEGVSFKNVTS